MKTIFLFYYIASNSKDELLAEFNNRFLLKIDFSENIETQHMLLHNLMYLKIYYKKIYYRYVNSLYHFCMQNYEYNL